MWGLGFGVWVLGFGFWFLGFGFCAAREKGERDLDLSPVADAATHRLPLLPYGHESILQVMSPSCSGWLNLDATGNDFKIVLYQEMVCLVNCVRNRDQGEPCERGGETSQKLPNLDPTAPTQRLEV